MKTNSAVIKQVSRPEKQFMYLRVGRFLNRDRHYDTVVDLGCGPMLLARHFASRRYIGVDRDEPALQTGMVNNPGAIGICSTIEHLDPTVRGDLVLCLQCVNISFEFAAERTLLSVQRIIDTTRPGGDLVMNVGPRIAQHFGDIESLLRRNFKRVQEIQYGRFREKRSRMATLLLAHLMLYVPALARDAAQDRRLYLCEGRQVVVH